MGDSAPASSPINLTHSITEVDGFTVVTERVPGVRSVALGAWVAVGSSAESHDEAGFAHFIEHLLFKGNERWSAADISRYFDGIGSDINAATTKEYTVFHSRFLDRHADEVLSVFGELLFAPAFDPKEFAAEREVILEEIAMYEDAPSDVVHELADLLVFGRSALGLPIVGQSATIAQSQPEQLAAFHRRFYVPENIIISAAGNVDHDAFVELVRTQMISRFAPTGAPVTTIAAASDAVSMQNGRVAHVVHKDAEQVHLVLAGRGISRSDDRRYAAALLDTILGNAPSSRLFLEIREQRGLAYSVYSFLSNYRDAGQVGMYVGVRPDRVDEVLSVLDTALRQFAQDGPTQTELEHAVRHLEGRMLLSLESTTVRGNRLGASLVTDMPIESLATTVERIRRVTIEDICELARELFHPDKLHVAAVGEDVDAIRHSLTSKFGLNDSAFATGDQRINTALSQAQLQS